MARRMEGEIHIGWQLLIGAALFYSTISGLVNISQSFRIKALQERVTALEDAK